MFGRNKPKITILGKTPQKADAEGAQNDKNVASPPLPLLIKIRNKEPLRVPSKEQADEEREKRALLHKSGPKLRVFLCHSSEDKPRVRDLYKRLTEDGCMPWLDEKDLLPGQDWQREIRKAVSKCHVVVVCLSKKSVGKQGYINSEIKLALDEADKRPEDTIFIIPARFEEVEVPERLQKWHWADLFKEEGYRLLLSALTKSAEALAE